MFPTFSRARWVFFSFFAKGLACLFPLPMANRNIFFHPSRFQLSVLVRPRPLHPVFIAASWDYHGTLTSPDITSLPEQNCLDYVVFVWGVYSQKRAFLMYSFFVVRSSACVSWLIRVLTVTFVLNPDPTMPRWHFSSRVSDLDQWSLMQFHSKYVFFFGLVFSTQCCDTFKQWNAL